LVVERSSIIFTLLLYTMTTFSPIGTWIRLSLFIAILNAAVIASPAFAQSTDNIVRAKLRQIALGSGSDVRAELPELNKTYPNDPGLQFLTATMIADGTKALPMFVRIVREKPESIWADDAQWRTVQIYALRKDTANARSELQTFRRHYPTSEFLLFAAEIVKSTVGLPPSFSARSSVVVASTQRTASIGNTSIVKPEVKPDMKPDMKSEVKPLVKTESKVESKVEPKAEQPTLASTSLTTKKTDPKTDSPKVTTSNDEMVGTHYTLQVGLYGSRENALAEVQRLLKSRMRADVVERTTDGAGKFAVTVGDYTSREAAERAKGVVQKVCTCVPFVLAK
jgi:cell division septation protein DedD